MKKATLILFVSLAVISPTSAGQYLGQLSHNPYAQNSTSEVGVNNYRIPPLTGSVVAPK
jgi:uncharacterized phage infection (PIP) family protein YhgE